MAKITLNIEAESPEDLQTALRGLAYVGVETVGYTGGLQAIVGEAPAEDPKPKSTRKAKESPAPAAGAETPAANQEASSAGDAADPQPVAAAEEPAATPSSDPAPTAAGGQSAPSGDATLDTVKAALTAALGRTNAKVCQTAIAGVTGGPTSLTAIASDMPDKLGAVQAALEALQ